MPKLNNIIKRFLFILLFFFAIRTFTSLILTRGSGKTLLLQFVLFPLWLICAWRFGMVVILIPFALFVWYQHPPLPAFLQSFLYNASFAEIAIYLAIFVYLVKNFRPLFNGMEFQKQIPTTENRARVIAKRFSWNIPYIKMLLAYAFIAFMVFFFGIAPNRQFSILALRWCVIAPICAYIIINRLELQKDIEYIILSFMLGSIMLSVISILAYSGCFPRLPWHFNIYALYGVRYEEYGAIDRLAAAYQIPIFGAMDIGGNLTVIFASFAIPLAVSLLLYTKRQRLKQLIALAALAFNLIVVIISASRSVWIGVFVSSILVVLLNKKILEFRTFAYLLLIGIVSVLTVVMLSKIGYISYEISERISELLEILKGRLGAYEYWKYQTGGRDITWREGLSVAIRYPFGTGFMESFAPAGGMDLGPHSQYLFLLLGTGITGAAVFFLFLVRCAYKCFTSCNIDNYTSSWIIKGAVAVVVCYLFDAIMIHTFLVAGVDILLLLICGAGVRLVELSRGKTSD